MRKAIRLTKGLDFLILGEAGRNFYDTVPGGIYAIQPGDFPGLTPKMVVKEGDMVKAGETLFEDKLFPEVKYVSPVSGTVSAIVRGDRRKVVRVEIEAAEEQQSRKLEAKDPEGMDAREVVDFLLDAGLFGFINQLPYAVTANPRVMPKSIFISTVCDMPLSGDFAIELNDGRYGEIDGRPAQHVAFNIGLKALARVAKVYIGVSPHSDVNCVEDIDNLDIVTVEGKCPAGNVGVLVNHLDPVNKGETVWTVDPATLLYIGRAFICNHVDFTRSIALCGAPVTAAGYYKMVLGQRLSQLFDGTVEENNGLRVNNGNALTGRRTSADGFLGAHASEVSVINDGANIHELFGWIRPRTNQFSSHGSYFSWLRPQHTYRPDTRVKGGRRNMIMSGEYDKVFPMDIYPEFLIKAIIAGDIDRMEQLGIYEVAPEDFAVAEFVDSSKLELQRIVREGLDILRKENS